MIPIPIISLSRTMSASMIPQSLGSADMFFFQHLIYHLTSLNLITYPHLQTTNHLIHHQHQSNPQQITSPFTTSTPNISFKYPNPSHFNKSNTSFFCYLLHITNNHRYNAQLVAKGFHQQLGVNYTRRSTLSLNQRQFISSYR
ncbi:hypothetical protein OSB04_001505 [Centaurea solstitialis]|uniref:Uncharacterized protein n=1 Tax=Centaurea solstitialis TaxID=347529 RepID=A0AA38TSX6_9ASTR|nr:hypothetical protein OSB04_001505 [Centaurea solstitialis]